MNGENEQLKNLKKSPGTYMKTRFRIGSLEPVTPCLASPQTDR